MAYEVLPPALIKILEALIKNCGQLLLRLRERNLPSLREDLEALEEIIAQIDDLTEDHRLSHEIRGLYNSTLQVLNLNTN